MISVLIDLGKRAVACKYWRWMPGMKAIGRWPGYPVRLYYFGEKLYDTDDIADDSGYLRWRQTHVHEDGGYEGPYYPDLTDPATLGCLLALVRKARNNPAGFVVPECNGNWTYYTQLYNADYWTGGSEAEALVIALENAL